MFVNVGLTGFKLLVGVVSGSVGVLSEGLHSFLDLISAGVAYFTVREAGKPADPRHPYGHGKIETLSSLLESILLVVAAGIITYEGVMRVLEPKAIEHEWIAMVTILVSLVVSYFSYRHNLKAAEETESSAIRVNALHFLSDVVASLGVLVGLVLLKMTGWLIIDPIMAFLIAIYIVAISYRQILGALAELADSQLPEEEMKTIRHVLRKFRGRVIEAHDLRTRKSGTSRHLDFHMVVCGQMSVQDSHAVCDEMEQEIQSEFPGASISIHVEPCEHVSEGCGTVCVNFQNRKEKAEH